jgi:lipid II:glycine glycyltransferase (peptidoglycan interpeptide bridge formation enzyme)
MIKWAHGLGCERYDFRGTATGDPPSEDDPGYGVYKFKQSFGPEFTRLTGYYDLVQRPLLYRAFRMTEDHLLPVAYRVKTWMQ